MKKLVFYPALLFIITQYSVAQNLIPNPSFEEHIRCPTDPVELKSAGQIHFATPWLGTPLSKVLFKEGAHNVEYIHECSTTPYYLPVSAIRGSQSPKTGKGYAGIGVYSYNTSPNNSPNSYSYSTREYLQVKLEVPLQNNQEYLFYCYASLGEDSHFAIKNLQAYFSPVRIDTAAYRTSDEAYILANPQISHDSFVTDSLGWTKVSGKFIANGDEQYVLIGNFLTETDTLQVKSFIGRPTNINVYINSYYYIDDVHLYPCDHLIELGDTLQLYEGGQLQLDAFIDDATYLWQDGSTDSVYTVTQAGTYWAEVWVEGCHSRDSVVVTMADLPTPPISNLPDLYLCEGDTLLLDLADQFDGDIFWNGSDCPQSWQQITQPFQHTILSKKFGMTVQDTFDVFYENFEALSLGNDTTLCDGEVLLLDATTQGAVAYLWDWIDTTPTLAVTQSGRYRVEVFGRGCSITDTIQVTFFDCIEEIPNAFSPNGDRVNDTFEIMGIDKDAWRLQIINRWGEVVFESEDYQNDWGAENLAEGLYYYFLSNPKNGETFKGWVQVLR